MGSVSGCRPEPGIVYVAGIDIAGEAEGGEDAALRFLKPRHDSTVVTIGELNFTPSPTARLTDVGQPSQI